MKIFKFKNETYEFNLHFLIYDHTNKEHYDRVLGLMVKSGAETTPVIKVMDSSAGFFCGGSVFYIAIDINEFDLSTYDGVIELMKVIQHECQHVRGEVLTNISETIDRVDDESHLRISDWAVKKCFSTLFIKSLLKLQVKAIKEEAKQSK